MTVGEYTLLSRIGEGGMGVVHLARRADGHRVALKVLRPHIVGDDEARARLAREVSSLSRVRSRWVAEIVDSDPWAEIPFVATRYVPGLSLHDHVVDEGPITGADLTWFAGCLAEGVASVHEVGVLHRDIKPSNVLMEGRTPILIDFGLARVADDPKLTHTGWLLGTPGYLAPEILYGDDATAASDVHSWAATVAYAGTGRAPFGRGPSMAIMDRVRRGEHDLSGLPDGLRGVIAAALDPDPTHRPTLDRLLAWLRPQTTRVQAVVPPPPTVPDDPYTVPLAIAAQAAAEQLRNDETDVIPFPGTASTSTTHDEHADHAEYDDHDEYDAHDAYDEPRPTRLCGTTPTSSAPSRRLEPRWPSAAGGRCCSGAVPWPRAPRWRRTPGRPWRCWSWSRGCCAAARWPRAPRATGGGCAAASGTTGCSSCSPRRGTWSGLSPGPSCSCCGASGWPWPRD